MSVLTLRSARAHTLPPRPPSPPSGPPRGTYFSRRNEATPSPPLPACTSIFASSMNFMALKMKKPHRRRQGFSERGSGLRRYDAHGLARVLAFHRIQHLAGDAREERVVAPHADVGAGMHLRAALAHEDLPGVDALAAEGLDAEALGLGIAPVARAAACFLVGHALPLHDSVDADLGVRLPMALRFLVVLASAQLEDAQLFIARLRHHRALHLRAGDERRADLQVVAFADEQNLV